MITIKKHPQIECSECGCVIDIALDIEAVDSDEREMGSEVTYEGEYEEKCPSCGNDISGRFTVWEYPEGSINDVENIVDGAEVLWPPEYACEYEDLDEWND